MRAGLPERQTYGMAPQIRFTLLALYVALVMPLPLLAPQALSLALWLAGAIGLGVVMAITSEQVILDPSGLQLSHPGWCRWWLKRGWQLRWDQVEGLTPVATSQGGRVFYVRTSGGEVQPPAQTPQAYLLPQRVERFEEFLQRFAALSGVSTDAVARITPAWTYQILAGMSVVMLLGELAAFLLISPSN